MSYYAAVAIYDLSGDFLGYAIRDTRTTNKLQSLNLWKEGQEGGLNSQLGRLNEQAALKDHWPSLKDPEVQALLQDPSFEPIEYEEQEAVDEEKSHYVYKQIAGTEGEWIDGDVDEEASTIVIKTVSVPKRPTDAMLRIKKACEIVARRRAGA